MFWPMFFATNYSPESGRPLKKAKASVWLVLELEGCRVFFKGGAERTLCSNKSTSSVYIYELKLS